MWGAWRTVRALSISERRRLTAGSVHSASSRDPTRIESTTAIGARAMMGEDRQVASPARGHDSLSCGARSLSLAGASGKQP